ncbi:Crp/Fnr family transcriptional regulator [Sphingosinicella sp. BN140058]|uniref:Crp/Fnr family transcriptional regulator n=1 Tax=Sphingosinicella sp. BN140058 TaxID=1892855 RepID=UPI00352A9DB2
MIVDGLVGRFGQNSDGNRQITALHIGGDMADLHSVVVPGSATALQALAVTTILRVPHEALRRLARDRPAIAEAFWRECVIDGAILSEWVVNVGRRDARTRTAHLLCEMAIRCRAGVLGRRFSFGFPVTQNHLADMLALTPVHVNRMLKCLREEGAADLRGKTAHVLDWQLLADIGDFDPSYLQIGTAPAKSAHPSRLARTA